MFEIIWIWKLLANRRKLFHAFIKNVLKLLVNWKWVFPGSFISVIAFICSAMAHYFGLAKSTDDQKGCCKCGWSESLNSIENFFCKHLGYSSYWESTRKWLIFPINFLYPRGAPTELLMDVPLGSNKFGSFLLDPIRNVVKDRDKMIFIVIVYSKSVGL